jgi:hypothetical protein
MFFLLLLSNCSDALHFLIVVVNIDVVLIFVELDVLLKLLAVAPDCQMILIKS